MFERDTLAELRFWTSKMLPTGGPVFIMCEGAPPHTNTPWHGRDTKLARRLVSVLCEGNIVSPEILCLENIFQFKACNRISM